MRDIKRLLEEDIKLQEKLIKRYKQELRNMPAGYLTVRKRKGGCAYFVNTGVSGAKGKERRQRYLKQSEGKKVWQLQMKRLMQEAVKRMERNVEREKKWAALYQPYDFLSVQKDMREAYQNLSAEQLCRGQFFFRRICWDWQQAAERCWKEQRMRHMARSRGSFTRKDERRGRCPESWCVRSQR